MKRKKTYIKIAVCIFFLAAAIIFTIISMEYESSDSTRQWYQMFAAVCIAGALICVFGEDGAKGLKKAAQNFRSFFQGFAKKIVQKFASMFGMRSGKGYKGTGFITDYQDTSIKIKKNTVQKKNQKRYKDMNNAERIRYFYVKLLHRQIKKGFLFRCSFTADEIEKQLLEDKKISSCSHGLFQIYNEARYNIKADITSEDVEKIKKIYKNP